MEVENFRKIADSLRQYRRAELRDFEATIGENPVEILFVDPLQNDAVLNTTISGNTVFLIGRKGTGKSTIFAKAQADIRKKRDQISIYVDVNNIYQMISDKQVPVQSPEIVIIPQIYQIHMIRKAFLNTVLKDLLNELREITKEASFIERWLGRNRKYDDAMRDIDNIITELGVSKLNEEEIPSLTLIQNKIKEKQRLLNMNESSVKGGAAFNQVSSSLSLNAQQKDINETLNDNEVYNEYSNSVLRSLPYSDIVKQIKALLSEVGMNKLHIFFDDFSEIEFTDQKLFVDTILAPLNNTSDEYIKLKIAGYPGRIYYGNIDPQKAMTINLDFYDIYKSKTLQTCEQFAIDYTKRLIEKRFDAFGANFSDYFDTSLYSYDEYMRLFFETTFNVPRLIGIILYNCFLDRTSRNQLITPVTIRLSAEKFYDDIVKRYFDTMSRFAREPYDQKLDRRKQQELLKELVGTAKDVKRQIVSGAMGGTYFQGITNPPVSHFAVSPQLEKVLSSLEFNFLLTKYHNMRDKDGLDVSIYAFSYGLCEAEKFSWGYPKQRREDKDYFAQRCFNYNSVVYQFLLKNDTIRCNNCCSCFPLDQQSSIQMYDWKCPKCSGLCEIVNLRKDFECEIDALDKDLQLPKEELEILTVLQTEDRKMRAGEISPFLDLTYQFVGKRTEKLKEKGLVDKERGDDDKVRNNISSKAKRIYFP